MAIALFRISRFPTLSWIFFGSIIFSMVATVLISTSSHLHWIGESDKLSGDVYHSAKVFGMDYAEMERKFKVYVYPEDEEDDDQITNTISGKYASEGFFFKNIRESVFLTHDSTLPHLFFIPISCHKLHHKVSSYKEMTSIVGKYVGGLIQRYPYWNRSLGADHFFLTCHDIDVGATQQVPFLVKNSIRVVCSPSYATAGFIPHKDVSLPLVMQPFSKPGNDMHKRTILGYWAGISSSHTRKQLVNLWEGDEELDIQNSTAYYGRMRKFYSAKFCICPVGSRFTTNRITMAIHYGCVPVILADYFDLPFNDILDWRKFSVIVSESNVHDLKHILKAKAGGADYRMLHDNLLKVQRHFQWNTPPVKYDTFHMVLYELWLRRNVIR
ncbi:hypothetical protein OROGR_009702 [Orobanche gracilis]